MHAVEPNRYAEGIPAAFTEPPAAARLALPELDKALKERDAAHAQQHQVETEIQRLRDGLPAARIHDRHELAEAAAAGLPDPPSTADAADEMITKLSRRSVALSDKVNQAQARVDQTIRREQAAWTKQLQQRITERAGEYLAAVEHVAQTRARLADEIHVQSWLTAYPEQRPLPRVHDVPQPPEFEDKPARAWSHLLADLRRDAETLPTKSVLPPGQDAGVLLNEFIDRYNGLFVREGDRRARWFPGRSAGVWEAHDKIAAIRREVGKDRTGDVA